MSVELAPFNVRGLVNAVVSQVQRAAEEKGLEARERPKLDHPPQES